MPDTSSSLFACSLRSYDTKLIDFFIFLPKFIDFVGSTIQSCLRCAFPFVYCLRSNFKSDTSFLLFNANLRNDTHPGKICHNNFP